MANFVVAGGTGFIGKYLMDLLAKDNHQIFVLTTKPHSKNTARITYVFWNPQKKWIDPTFRIEQAIVINLAGAGVAEKKWTDERKQLILSSRVDSLQTLLHAKQTGQIDILKLVSASAIGFYGSEDKFFTENDTGDDSFLSVTCKAWEQAAFEFEAHQVPLAIVRVGIVMGKEAGALHEFLKPIRFGIAGIPGSGKQMYSWIAAQDVAEIFYFLAATSHVGIYNAVASQPCDMNQIFDAIKTVKKVWLTAHAPGWILKLLLGEMAIEVLKSAYVSNEKIKEAGFRFQYETIEAFVQKEL